MIQFTLLSLWFIIVAIATILLASYCEEKYLLRWFGVYDFGEQ